MKSFYELEKLELLIKNNPSLIRAEQLALVKVGDTELPVWSVCMGSCEPGVPVLALFGGVHGLERIGSRAVLAYLSSLINRYSWDSTFQELLKKIRIISIPIVNPSGMLMHRRSNLNGVDLMRNAPQDAKANIQFLVSGHRLTPHLPWYRGKKHGQMETESLALINFFQSHAIDSPFIMSLDVHSGFGLNDRIWYPYGCSSDAFPDYQVFQGIHQAFSDTFPYHVYEMESQIDSYGIHGDLWDYLTLENQKKTGHASTTLIPLTLELGSWRWVKKNPQQLFDKSGIFNPIKRHRYERVMRRHFHLFDFLFHATVNYKHWGDKQR